MSFNFNEVDLEKAEEGKVFNNGVAGRTENVKVSMEKLGTDYESDSPNAPAYRVIFEDSEGRKTNYACFSINSADFPDQWGRTYEAQIKKEWAYLCKIAEHSGGTKPMSFADDKDLFAKMYAGGIGPNPLNVFTNYGTKSNPKDRLEVRKWLPAVEAAGTSAADSKLVPGSLDQMTVITPDAEGAAEDLSSDGFI